MQEAGQHTRGSSCGVLCEACRPVCSVFSRVLLGHPGEAVSVLGLPWDPGWKAGITHIPVRHRGGGVAVLTERELRKHLLGRKEARGYVIP